MNGGRLESAAAQRHYAIKKVKDGVKKIDGLEGDVCLSLRFSSSRVDLAEKARGVLRVERRVWGHSLQMIHD